MNKLYDEDYVLTHTNALYLSDEAFDFKDGVFSGYDETTHTYDTKTWGFGLRPHFVGCEADSGRAHLAALVATRHESLSWLGVRDGIRNWLVTAA